jgi:hypothetical protein
MSSSRAKSFTFSVTSARCSDRATSATSVGPGVHTPIPHVSGVVAEVGEPLADGGGEHLVNEESQRLRRHEAGASPGHAQGSGV